MTITLEAIKAKHEEIDAKQSELGELIEKFRLQGQGTEVRFPAAVISLSAGERLAGMVLNDDGSFSHYLIKLPGEAVEVNFSAARDWAVQQGGDLPTRKEQALLYANLKGEFSANWYWSGEEKGDGFAWYQDFDDGGHYCYYQGNELRAVAVRRFIPSVI